MPDLSTLALFAAACLALTATPGPDMMLIVSRSVSQGQGAGFATLAGIQVGTYCHALAAAFGLAELFLIVPHAYDAVRYLGAGYLLYLAWKTVRHSGAAHGPGSESRQYPIGQVFRQGLLTNMLNPKMALFILALFPQFVRLDSGSVTLQIMLLATVLNFVGFLVNGIVIVMAGRAGKVFMGRSRLAQVPQYLLATVFAGLAVKLAFEGRR